MAGIRDTRFGTHFLEGSTEIEHNEQEYKDAETTAEPGTMAEVGARQISSLQHLRRPIGSLGQGIVRLAGSIQPTIYSSTLDRYQRNHRPRLPTEPPWGVRPSPFFPNPGPRQPTEEFQLSRHQGIHASTSPLKNTLTVEAPRQPSAQGLGAVAPAGAVTGGGTSTQEMQMAMLHLMDKITEKLDDISGGTPQRSTTRIKFPDFRASKFHGDETKFLSWLLDWTELLKLDPGLSDHAKLILLKQHLSSEVKQQLLFTSSDSLPYEDCMAILLSKYARTHSVRRAYRRKIQELTGPASNSDYRGLDRMLMETKKIMNALELLGQTTLEVGVLIQDALIDKLPNRMYGELIRFGFSNTGRDVKSMEATELIMVLETFAQIQEDVQDHDRNIRSTGQYEECGQDERKNGEDTENEDNTSGSEREDSDNEEDKRTGDSHPEDSSSEDQSQENQSGEEYGESENEDEQADSRYSPTTRETGRRKFAVWKEEIQHRNEDN